MLLKFARLLILAFVLVSTSDASGDTGLNETAPTEDAGVENEEFLTSVFVSGAGEQTLFPDLRTYCRNYSYRPSIPYNTIFGHTHIWGYGEGKIEGCGTSSLSMEGDFIDDTELPYGVGRNSSSTGACKGTLVITQTAGQMKVTWKDIKNYDEQQKSPCAQAGDKSFTLELKNKNISDLVSRDLSFYEYKLVTRREYPQWSSKFALRVVTKEGVPGFNKSDQAEHFKFGTILQSYACDRGGADFPDAENCFGFKQDGHAWGSVLEATEPWPYSSSGKFARFKRSDFQLVRLK